MTAPSIADLREFRVTFVMQAAVSKQRRAFIYTIPAIGADAALSGATQIASTINDATGHVWKLTDEFTVEAVTA